ncbi:O-antigen ligase family protein [Winogradskyella ursingii]|uniref:O-antigen ligase family protein n=1 Tax=Winogradskyella ursingii TaxID=2686079 RepID=UPI0015C69CAB|nr:O-antigen ligase family protein [Winogradskyella ursingii]
MKGRIPIQYIWYVSRNKILFLFLFWVFLSFTVNALWDYNYQLKNIPFRLSEKGDSFLRLGYVTLCIIAFFFSLYFFKNKNNNILKYWVLGSILAASYSWYLFISSAFGIPYIRLFGMEPVPQNLFGIIRSGTFKEGNFFGLYLILSAAIAFFRGNTKSGWFLLCTIITTMSTISLVSAFVFLIYVYRKKLFTGKILIIYPLIILAFFAFTKTEYFQKYVKKKMFQPVSYLTTENFSKVDRYITGRIAFKQGVANPFVGVGPYNFALHYDYYNDYRNVVLNPSVWFDDFIARKNIRGITNNVYLEVWAEYGILGFLIFILFLLKTLFVSLKNKDDLITGALLALFISFNAFPSFIMLFIWVFLALPYSINYQKRIIK